MSWVLWAQTMLLMLWAALLLRHVLEAKKQSVHAVINQTSPMETQAAPTIAGMTDRRHH